MNASERGRELVFAQDAVNEQQIVGAALVGSARALAAVKQYPPDTFLTPQHQGIWAAMREAVHRGLPLDPTTLARLSGGAVEVAYLSDVLSARPDAPDDRTIEFALETLLWDRQRHAALVGPVASLLESLKSAAAPEQVRTLVAQVTRSFESWGARQHLHDPEALVRAQIADLRARMSGRAVYPYGLNGLDLYDPPPGLDVKRPPAREKLEELSLRRRMIPGSAPGQVTVVTGVPGSGKSTTTCRIVLGLARQKRKVLYGAWEMQGGPTLELLAIQSLGWSRTDLTTGKFDNEALREIETRMFELSKHIRFLSNPFRRFGGGKPSNERNLDIVGGYIADSGCEVFVADLWKRCLVEARPEDEEEALYRQQAMAEELGVHCILVQQQRLKDIELRPDKRPTREGIKGSGAWTEIADTILGVHRPALWKPVPDNVLEVDVLKQRYGKWPLAVEFDWDPDRGMLSGGHSVEYDASAGGGSEMNRVDQATGAGRRGRR